MNWIIVYNPGGHHSLHLDTKHIGPYASFDEAYDALCQLPPPLPTGLGCKYIAELITIAAAAATGHHSRDNQP